MAPRPASLDRVNVSEMGANSTSTGLGGGGGSRMSSTPGHLNNQNSCSMSSRRSQSLRRRARTSVFLLNASANALSKSLSAAEDSSPHHRLLTLPTARRKVSSVHRGSRGEDRYWPQPRTSFIPAGQIVPRHSLAEVLACTAYSRDAMRWAGSVIMVTRHWLHADVSCAAEARYSLSRLRPTAHRGPNDAGAGSSGHLAGADQESPLRRQSGAAGTHERRLRPNTAGVERRTVRSHHPRERSPARYRHGAGAAVAGRPALGAEQRAGMRWHRRGLPRDSACRRGCRGAARYVSHGAGGRHRVRGKD